MNHGVWTNRHLHRLHPRKGFPGWEREVNGWRGLYRHETMTGNMAAVFPLSRKKRHFWHLFWTPANKNFENRYLHFWTQFPSLEEISQHIIWIFFQRCTGHIFTIKAVLRTQHTKSSDAFWEFSACKVYKEVLGAFSRFLHLKSKLFAMKFRCIFWVIRLQSLQKCFGRIFEVSTLQVKKKFWAHFLDFCVQKRRYFPWSSDAYRKFCLQVLQKKFLAKFHELSIQKRSGLLWSSDAFWKFSALQGS